MKKAILSILFLSVFFISGRAQVAGYDKLAQDLFNAFKYNDTALFLKCFITNKDANQLMYRYIQLNEIKDTSSFPKIEMPNLKALLKKEYVQARKLFADSGVRWVDAAFTDVYYNILKDKNSLYPSALGEVMFRSGSKYFALVLSDAVYMSGEWKLVSFRPSNGILADPTRVAYFTEEDELFQLHGVMPKKKEPAKKLPAKPVVKSKG